MCIRDRPVRAEAPHPRDVEDRGARPPDDVAPRVGGPPLTLHVSAEVGQDEEGVLLHQRTDEGPEEVRLSRREVAGLDEPEDVGQLAVRLDEAARVVTAAQPVLHLGRGQPEEEEVFLADGLTDLHVRAIERTDRERAVHGEFHVPGAGRLLARGGNLLGEIDRRVDPLGVLHVEVGNEDDGEEVLRDGVAPDGLSDGGGQADDQLRHLLGGRRLPREDEGARRNARHVAAEDALIEPDDVQQIELLPLVFVNALALRVEERVWVDGTAHRALDPPGQALLVGLLHGAPALPEPRVEANFSSPTRRSRSVSQPSPIASVMSDDRRGFDCPTNRRGVTPFVTFVKRPGQSSAKSERTVSRRSRECSAATPFTFWLATVARFAMRMLFSPRSSMRLRRESRPSSPGKRARASFRKRWLIS